MRTYHCKVSVLSPRGDYIRSVPSTLAHMMIQSGAAAAEGDTGKIRSVRLITTAASSAERIGEPRGECRGVRFTYWERLPESGVRVIAHSRRALDPPDPLR